MAIEKERKFLVAGEYLPEAFFKAPSFVSEAGYFTKNGVAIRVTMRVGGKCKVCFKSPSGNESRHEFEYLIPREDAETLMNLSPTRIKKTRTDFEGWEIDRVELSSGEVLWVAEWEEKEGKPLIPSTLPDWIVREVTTDIRYSMQAIAWAHGKKPECRHGVVFDEEEAKKMLAGWTPASMLDFIQGSPSHAKIREKWPRLNGKCPLGCGFEGIAYASPAHFAYGDW